MALMDAPRNPLGRPEPSEGLTVWQTDESDTASQKLAGAGERVPAAAAPAPAPAPPSRSSPTSSDTASVSLVGVRMDPTTRAIAADYEVTHATSGRGGTVLDLNLRVERGGGEVRAFFTDLEVRVSGEDNANAEEALDKLADWMERAARALRDRGAPAAAVTTYAKR